MYRTVLAKHEAGIRPCGLHVLYEVVGELIQGTAEPVPTWKEPYVTASEIDLVDLDATFEQARGEIAKKRPYWALQHQDATASSELQQSPIWPVRIPRRLYTQPLSMFLNHLLDLFSVRLISCPGPGKCEFCRQSARCLATASGVLNTSQCQSQ